jgi:putative transposase
MPDYRRYYSPGFPTFITCVTHNRRRILTSADDIALLRNSISAAKSKYQFELMAYVIIPDHFHLLLKMPEEDPDFSKALHKIKLKFTLDYKETHKIYSAFQAWQRGFWDHIIRNEADLAHHLDYIHWNPVKHGLATRVEDWKESSFRDWVEKGLYPGDWGDEKVATRISKYNYE